MTKIKDGDYGNAIGKMWQADMEKGVIVKKKRCYFSIADDNNLPHYEKLKNSLKKFSDIELRLFDEKFVKEFNDPKFYYRATPILAMKLFNEGYDEVCKLDADQIITGNIDDIFDGDFDAGVVLNDPTFPIGVWDIKPYFNCGLVVLKSKEFVLHWFRLCQSEHFDRYQMREQDLMNILASDYMNYKIKILDGDKIYGESAKPEWQNAVLKGDKIMIGDKELCVIHFGGGNIQKGNYRIKFTEDVVNKIDKLIK
jgi:hypothetical protein